MLRLWRSNLVWAKPRRLHGWKRNWVGCADACEVRAWSYFQKVVKVAEQ